MTVAALSSSPTTRPTAFVCPVTHLADAAVAGAMTLRVAKSIGFDLVRASEAALVASELSTNMVKYAAGGELVISYDPECDALELSARDRGPGPPSTEELFRDGFSRGGLRTPDSPSSGGLGAGGGALCRLSDAVTIRARDGGGTEVTCLFQLGGPVRPRLLVTRRWES